MIPTKSLADVWTDASWHLYQFDFATGMSAWLHLAETQFRDASFLDQRLLGPGQSLLKTRPAPISIPLEQLVNVEGGQSQAPASFIFHIGHCGSTLVSRALAATPLVLPVREPLTLRQLASLHGTLPAEQWSRCLQFALQAHSRGFRAGQSSMIKATSTCNALIRPVMDLLPVSRMLLLHVKLESFLAGMLGKQSPVQDLQGHAAARLVEWQAITGQVLPVPSNGFSEEQLAVLAWLTSMARLLQACEQNEQQCLLLDFNDFLASPETGLKQLCGFFQLEHASEAIVQAWPEISVGYSKQPDQPYSAFNRNRTLARGRTQRGGEIQGGLRWADELIQKHPALGSCNDYF